MITKGAVTPLTTSGFPAHDQVAPYRSLAPSSAALALFQQGMALSLDGVNTIHIPNASLTVPTIFVAEGAPAPNIDANFTTTILGPIKKILLLSAVSGELQNSTPEDASAIIGRIIADAANRGVDAAAFSSAAVTPEAPAGLLHGVAPITATAGGGIDAMTSDLGNLVGAIGAAGIDPNGVVFVCGPQEALTIKVRVGPKFDYQILTTLGLPPKSVAAFAPAGVVSGYQSAPTIETSKEAAYHFDNAPIDIGTAGGVAAPTKSLFQTNLIGIRVKAKCAWAVAPGAAQFIDAVSW
jgi:hypothetical protein